MKPLTEEQYAEMHARATAQLEPLGFVPMGTMLFFKGGKIYNLSAADLAQIERIEREGLFVVAE